MADGGLRKILITSPVATADKVERIVGLAKRVDELMVVVDHPDGVAELDRAARAAGRRLDVLIDLDTGTRRTGIAPGEPAAALARAVAAAHRLRLRGLQAYAGHVMHVPGHAARAAASHEALAQCLETRALLARRWIRGRDPLGRRHRHLRHRHGVEGVTDLQVGSYCFMDVQYRQIGDRDSESSTISSLRCPCLPPRSRSRSRELITVDAGSRRSRTSPRPAGVRATCRMIYHYAGDEHGIVQFTSDAPTAARPEGQDGGLPLRPHRQPRTITSTPTATAACTSCGRSPRAENRSRQVATGSAGVAADRGAPRSGLPGADAGRSRATRPNILWLSSEDNGPHLGATATPTPPRPISTASPRGGMIYRHAGRSAPVCAPARTTIISGAVSRPPPAPNTCGA